MLMVVFFVILGTTDSFPGRGWSEWAISAPGVAETSGVSEASGEALGERLADSLGVAVESGAGESEGVGCSWLGVAVTVALPVAVPPALVVLPFVFS